MTNGMKKRRPTQAGVNVYGEWSGSNIDPQVEDRPKKAVLYTCAGKPLTRGLERIGFTPNDPDR